MKKEELDRLKAKYWEGKTSLEEERRLKELNDEKFFTSLQKPETEMNWEFDEFMQRAAEQEVPKLKKVVPITRRIIMITAVAASVVAGFFLIRQIAEPNEDISQTITAQVEINNQLLDVENPKTDDKVRLTEDDTPEINTPLLRARELKNSYAVSDKRGPQKSKESSTPEQAMEEQLYVEINGVKIYDEEQAIKVTETALQLATSNLKKGMEGVENIKYLKIEI